MGETACPACSGTAPATSLCAECAEAFAVAKLAHPSAATPTPADADDLELWDAWSLLGDIGDRALRGVTD